MRRMLACLSLSALLAFSNGCAMCCAPFDCDYLYCGGRWVRDNPSSGRVGSVFDEAGHPVEPTPTVAASPAAPELLPTPAPQTRSVIPRNMGNNYLP